MMIKGCPLKTDPSWVKLNKVLNNEEAAYKVWMSHDGKLPLIENVTELKSRFKIDSSHYTSARLARVMKRVGAYNRVHDTSHHVEQIHLYQDEHLLKLHINYMPKQHNLEYNSVTQEVISEPDVDTVINITRALPDIITKDGNQYEAGGEIYPSYEDALASITKDELQLSATGINAENVELNDALMDLLEPYGITEKVIDNFKEKYGVDGVAVADMANKIIVVAKGKADESTLPEETAHFVTALMGTEHPLYKAAEKIIDQTDVYDQVKRDYGALYGHSEARIRKEAVDKVLSTYFIKRFENKTDLPIPVQSVFERIMNWFKNFFKKFDNSSLQTKLDEVFGTIANRTFDKSLQFDVDNLDSNKYYALDAPIKAQLKKNVSRLQLELNTLKSRKDAAQGDADIQEMAMAIEALETRIESDNIREAVRGFLEYAIKNELNHLLRAKEGYINGDDSTIPSSYTLNRMVAAVSLHETIIKDLQNMMEYSGDKEMREFYETGIMANIAQKKLGDKVPDFLTIKEQVGVVAEMVSELNGFVEHLDKQRLVATLRANMSEKSDLSPEQVVNSTIGDSRGPLRWFFPIHIASNEVLRIFADVLNKISLSVHRVVLGRGKDLLGLQEDMEKAGFKDMSIFHEKDSKGVATGYLLTEYNWGELANAYDAMKEKIEKLFDMPYSDVKEHIKELKKGKNYKDNPQLKEYNRLWDKFREDFCTRTDDGSYVFTPRVNPEFDRVMKLHPSVKAYYTMMRERHVESKDKLPVYNRTDLNYWLVPQIHKSVMQTIKYSNNTLMSELKNTYVDKFKVTNEDTEYGNTGDVVVSGNSAIKQVPIYYVHKLKDMHNLSNDFTSMYTLFDEMASNFRELSKYREDVEQALRVMAKTTVYKTEKDRAREEAGLAVGLGKKGIESNDYKWLVEFLERNLYSKQKKEIKFRVGKKEVNLSKVGFGIIDYIRKRNLLGQIFTMGSGFIKSTIDSTLEDMVGEFSTPESKAWAQIEFAKHLPALVRDINKRNKQDKFELMMEHNGVDGGIRDIFKKLDIKGRFARTSMEEVVYGGYAMVSTKVNGTLALAIYDNYRLVNGKFITKTEFKKLDDESLGKWEDYRKDSLWNAYEAKNGRFVVKPEYAKYVTKQFATSVQSVIKHRTAAVEGKLNSIDKGTVFGNVFGEALMLHRPWIISGAVERWKKGQINYNTDRYEEGFNRTFVRLLWKAFKVKEGGIKARLAVFQNLEDFEKRNLLKQTVDIAALAIVGILYKVMNNVADGDDDDEWWLEAMAYLSTRALLEQAAFYNPKEIMGILNSPSAATNMLDVTGTLFKSLFSNEEVEYGAYEGMTHREKALIQMSWFKNLYELQEPKLKNKYIRNQIF